MDLPENRCELIQMEIERKKLTVSTSNEISSLPQSTNDKFSTFLTQSAKAKNATPKEIMIWIELNLLAKTDILKHQSTLIPQDIRIHYEVQKILNMHGHFFVDFSVKENNGYWKKLWEIYVEQIYEIYVRYMLKFYEKKN